MGERVRVESWRVTLRDFQMTDVEDYMVWAHDEEVAHFCSWEVHKSREETEKYISTEVIPHPWLKAICVDGKAVGGISINRGQGHAECRGEIGYATAAHCWGKGIVTQAVKLAVSAAFRDLPDLERIEGLVEPQNVASQRVLEKAGFVKEGLLSKYLTFKGKTRDFYVYRMLSADFPGEAPS